jgi:hypothetical protein
MVEIETSAGLTVDAEAVPDRPGLGEPSLGGARPGAPFRIISFITEDAAMRTQTADYALTTGVVP